MTELDYSAASEQTYQYGVKSRCSPVELIKKRQLSFNSLKDDSVNSSDTSELILKKKQRFIWSPELHQKFISAIFDVGMIHSQPQHVQQVLKASGRKLDLLTIDEQLKTFRNFRFPQPEKITTKFKLQERKVEHSSRQRNRRSPRNSIVSASMAIIPNHAAPAHMIVQENQSSVIVNDNHANTVLATATATVTTATAAVKAILSPSTTIPVHSLTHHRVSGSGSGDIFDDAFLFDFENAGDNGVPGHDFALLDFEWGNDDDVLFFDI